MPTLNSSWVYVDLSPTIGIADHAYLITKPVPVEGTVKQVWLSINTVLAAAAGVVAISKNAVNLLSATNVDLATGLTGGVAASQTLSTTAASLKVLTTDTLKATWTLTTVAVTDSMGCLVAIEPSATW
jgi:hypothetical protein